MSKFAHCHPENGMMWCQHYNGSWAPPFPIQEDKKRKAPSKKKKLSK